MSNSNTNTSGGIGFTGMLAIVFIVLKLCKVIAWSWLWVLSPIWIPISIFLAIIVIVIVIKLIIMIIEMF